jgi:16S rRNA processing protein RimM
MTTAQADLVTIGKIERPFGVKGAVKVRSLSDVPGRFEQLGAVSVMSAGGRAVDRTVTHVRQAGSTYIVQFDGISTPEEASTLQGALIQVPRCEPSSRQCDVFYECDLIGMTVVDEAGHELGLIETIWELPGHQVFVVKQDAREVLIPAAKDFVTAVDLAQKRMTVRTIEGLVETSYAL